MKILQKPLLAITLVAAYPILSFYFTNFLDVGPFAIFCLTVLSCLASILMYGLLTLALKDRFRAGVLTSIAIFFILNYGNIYERLPASWEVRHRQYLLLLTFLFSLIVWKTRKANNRILTEGVVLLQILLFALAIIQFGRKFLEFKNLLTYQGVPAIPQSLPTKPATRPSIVLVILDEYARGDVLREVFQADDTDFLKGLEQRGFTVAGESLTNYSFTLASVASLLNFEYLPALPGDQSAKASARSWTYWTHWIQHNRLFDYFRKVGYQVKVHSYCSATAMTGPAKGVFRGQFYDLLRYGTIASAWDAFRNPRPAHIYSERRATLEIFDALDRLDLSDPTFVFAHVLCPHRPLVFRKDGGSVDTGGLTDEQVYRQFYPGQCEFVGQRALQSVDAILKNNATPPIIIIMSDHGSMSLMKEGTNWEDASPELIRERMPNLCAIYLPGHQLKPEELQVICPVNVFRLVLNKYFEANLELLPRTSHWIHGPRDVTDLLQSKSTP